MRCYGAKPPDYLEKVRKSFSELYMHILQYCMKFLAFPHIPVFENTPCCLISPILQ